MGGKPLLAMNILACPIKSMGPEIIREVIKGGLSKVVEAGALLVGGHSVEDDELKYGLSVTGVVHPDHVLLNSGAKVGDRLILTKPLGTGILATAIKGNLAGAEIEKQITEIMATLNQAPAEAIAIARERGHKVHACTDITGFGLLGHLHEMAVASKVTARIFKDQIPVISGCIDFINMGIIPEGAYTNHKFYSKWLQQNGTVNDVLEMVLSDPQTSGGLLIAAPEETSKIILQEIEKSSYPFSCHDIGEIVEGETGAIQFF